MRKIKIFALLLVVIGALLAITIGISWHLLQPPGLQVPDRQNFLLENVTIVNPGIGNHPAQTYVIENSKIISIDNPLPAESDINKLTGYEGSFITPGLIDMHVHFPPDIAVGNAELFSVLFLAYGVTTVRDMGSIDGNIFALRKSIQEGELPGPRIFTCGKMLDGDPPDFPSNRTVRNAREATDAVHALAAQGIDFIKVYNRMSIEALNAIHETAAAYRLPVIGHVPHLAGIKDARLTDIQHLTGFPVFDTPPAERKDDFQLRDFFSVDSARVAFISEISLAENIAHTPTFINLAQRELLAAPERKQDNLAFRTMPDFWEGAWGFIWGANYEANRSAPVRIMKNAIHQLHENGVKIHAGTDTMMPFVVPGWSLQAELSELVDAGLSVEDVWKAASTEAGGFFNYDDLGTLKVGAPADFLIFKEDPTESLEHLNSLQAVVADGRLYSKEMLDGYLAQYQQHFHGKFYSTIMNKLVDLVKGNYVNE